MPTAYFRSKRHGDIIVTDNAHLWENDPDCTRLSRKAGEARAKMQRISSEMREAV